MMAPAPRLPENLLDQPTPALTLYGKMRRGSFVVTAIARAWHPGDAARCDLCTECSWVDDHCLILIHNRIIPPEECTLYRQPRPDALKVVRP
jgi:hypothetical protein